MRARGVVYAIANGGFLPNATLFSGSFLLGPGFAVGGNTLVSPGAVVLGPLPLFALLAALPRTGTPGALLSSWSGCRRWSPRSRRCGGSAGTPPRPGWRPRCAAVAAGSWPVSAFAVLASVAGGAVGPGRMRYVGPFVPDVLVAAITAFGLGGLLGALAMAWYQRRGSVEEP